MEPGKERKRGNRSIYFDRGELVFDLGKMADNVDTLFDDMREDKTRKPKKRTRK